MKIKWKVIQLDQYIRAEIGFIAIRCFGTKTISSKILWWEADISCNEISHTFKYTSRSRSLKKIKQDAERIAKEMLIDYYVALISQINKFDILDMESICE